MNVQVWKIGLLCALPLVGCSVGPNFKRPGAPVFERYMGTDLPGATAGDRATNVGPQTLTQGALVDGRWWTRFGSPRLDALVELALDHNADLATARNALRVARQTYLAQRGALFPAADAQAQASRNQSSAALSPPLSVNKLDYSLYSGQFNISYTLDVFGGVRRAVESAEAQAEQQRFQTRAVYLALTNSLVSAVFQLAVLRAQLTVVERQSQVATRLAELTDFQRAEGQVSGSESALAHAQLAQVQGALPALRKQIAQQLDLIAVLSGRSPAELGVLDIPLDTLRLPPDLPVSLPLDLVNQRPDVRMAEANVHAAAAQLGVAMANRLPAFVITGNAGGVSTRLRDVLSNGNPTWSIVGGLTQPLFEGGALKHRQRAAEASLDQAREQYRATLLTAAQNVADVLAAVTSDAEALVTAQASSRAAHRAMDLAGAQHSVGQSSALPWLNAEAAALQTDLTERQARAARFTDSVALYVALGGGWWNRGEGTTADAWEVPRR